MPHYVTVVSTNPSENHEAGFVGRPEADQYARDILWVYLQRLDRETRRNRREKELFSAAVRRQLSAQGRTIIAPDWAEIIGLREILIAEESLQPLGTWNISLASD
jgi:hypothetical protein